MVQIMCSNQSVKENMDFNPELLMQLLEQDLGYQADELRHFKAEALKKSLLKKYVKRGSDRGFQTAAFKNFLALNEKAKAYVVPESFLTSSLFRRWRVILDRCLMNDTLQGPLVTMSRCFELGGVGPGASVGSSDTTFFTKMFNSRLATSNAFLAVHYNEHLSGNWLKAELLRQHLCAPGLAKFQLVSGSKLGSVPKDRTKHRTTCTEPLLNMFYQLGAKNCLEDVLLHFFGLNLKDQQTFNRTLACYGSRTGLVATLDLKDASDLITVALCRALLPHPIYRVLMRIRSERCKVGSEYHELGMMATMGNGFCFALMTLLFVSLVQAVHEENGEEMKLNSTSAVFGDDIIIPSHLYQNMHDALSSAGLVVNTEKSFAEGPFRESCGGDYFNGHDVRGIYIKRFDNEAHCYSAFNRLHLWSLRHGFCLERTLCYIKQFAAFRPVPADAGFDSGFITTSAELTNPRYAKERDSHRTWRNSEGIAIRRVKPQHTHTPKQLVYKCIVPVPRIIGRCSERFTNYWGGLISFLGGYVRDDQVLLRQEIDNVQYQVVQRSTPSWDWIPYPGINCRDLSLSWLRILNTETPPA